MRDHGSCYDDAYGTIPRPGVPGKLGNMFDLTGKTALVTGAASGIGAAIAEALAGAGAFVFVADIDEKGGLETVARIGASADFLRLDVASVEDCERAVGVVDGSRPNGLDVLVNNAGIGHVGTILDTSAADFDRLFAVNVRGMFALTKSFLPGMIARRRGSVVNMASVGGVVAVKDRFAYCATKFAVVGMTKSLALDHALDGVRFNCICPGRIETPFVAARIAEYPDPEAAYREMAATQAVGRMGLPSEVAAAAVYLASDEAAFVTGSELMVDGGFTVGK